MGYRDNDINTINDVKSALIEFYEDLEKDEITKLDLIQFVSLELQDSAVMQVSQTFRQYKVELSHINICAWDLVTANLLDVPRSLIILLLIPLMERDGYINAGK